MGMFNWFRCKYPLPLKGANRLLYQTKDPTYEDLCVAMWELREDGTLWREAYDSAWQNDVSVERTNKRWEPVVFTGELSFYDWIFVIGKQVGDGVIFDGSWHICWEAIFESGRLKSIKCIQDDTGGDVDAILSNGDGSGRKLDWTPAESNPQP